MIAVAADDKEICVRIPTSEMTADEARALVDWLRVEVISRQSRLTEDRARELSEEFKADWWARNQARFPGE